MRIAVSKQAHSAIVAAVFAASTAFSGSAKASVYLSSPSLPLIDIPYVSPGGAGCFTVAGVCVAPGPLTLTSIISSTFVPAENMLPAVQDIVTNVAYDATLTPLAGDVVIGSVSLTGTVEEQVLGRTSDTATGAFATDIVGLSLSGKLMLSGGGPLDGATLMVTLGGSPSTGMTTITPVGSEFRIDSFFDVFVDLSLEGTALSRSVGPVLLVAVPEPSTWALMLAGFVGLGFAGYRRAKAAVSAA